MPLVIANECPDSCGATAGTKRREGNNMKPIIELATMSLLLSISVPNVGVAQTTSDLVGTWTNVSNVNIQQDGSRTDVFGPHRRGVAMFANNGRFVIVNINPDVPKFASNNRAQGTDEENRAAMLGGIALYGTYWVGNKTIFFKVEGSTYPNWTGTEQARTVISFTGDDLKWSLRASIGGTTEVAWKRVK